VCAGAAVSAGWVAPWSTWGCGASTALVPNVCLRDHGPRDVPVPSALKEDLVAHAAGRSARVLAQIDLARFILTHEGRFGLALAQRSGPPQGASRHAWQCS